MINSPSVLEKITLIPPREPYITFKTDFEILSFVIKHDLAKYRTKKQGDVWLYKGRNCPRSGIPCELYGYQLIDDKFEQLIIKFDDGSLHCILHLHLREMQNNQYDNTVYYHEEADIS